MKFLDHEKYMCIRMIVQVERESGATLGHDEQEERYRCPRVQK